MSPLQQVRAERQARVDYWSAKGKADHAAFIKSLRQTRIDLEMTQDELAQLLGTSRGAVSMWELGERWPLGPSLFAWAGVLNMEVGAQKIS